MTSDSLTPTQRSLRAKLAAHAKWAQTGDPAEATRPARDKFMARFLDEVDPERVLPDDERQRRAEHARKSYFTKLAYKSARARAAKAATTRTP